LAEKLAKLGIQAVSPTEATEVKAGVAFARARKMKFESMLHFEAWTTPPKPGAEGRWYVGQDPPEGLLDPTTMLLDLARRHSP
jgi:hypothetical protein